MKKYYTVLAVVIIVAAGAIWKLTDNLFKDKPEPVETKHIFAEEPEEVVVQEEPTQKDAGVSEHWYGLDKMEKEIVAVWTMFLDDAGSKKSDKRRSQFGRFAGYLADAVTMYQESDTEIGGRLPKHKNTHILLATMVTFESSVYDKAIGRKDKEAGLLQIMPNGPAMAGYHPDEVSNDPRLGLLLGTRWLASRIPKCGLTLENWDDYNWLGPLSAYQGNQTVIRKDGTCKVFKTSRERIDRMLVYRTRIDFGAKK